MMKRVLSVVFAAALLVGLLAMFPVAANATSGMTISQECVDVIKQIEGFYAIPYWDYSQWTVGFGTTCPDDKLDQYKKYGIPMDEANALMKEQLAKFEDSVNSFIEREGLTLTQGQFDAMVSLTYNLGSALLYNENHRIFKAVVNGATGNELIFAFSAHCAAGGEFLPGLMRRRLAEANMYINGKYDNYAPENYCYVLYDANGGTKDVLAQGYDCNLASQPLSVPTYEGHTFVGWFTEPNGGTRVTTLDESYDCKTLYAHWEDGATNGDSSTLPDGGLAVTVEADAVNVRNGPGIDYAIVSGVFRDDVITITGLADADGARWGKFSGGWVNLNYTNYAKLTGDYGPAEDGNGEGTQVQVPIRATVLSTGGTTVYTGPHTTYPTAGTLKEGTEIEITELFSLFDVLWGKCEQGWVQINLRLLLHDSQKLAHSFTATVTYYYLNVRSGPGVGNSLTTTLQKGAVVQIVAVEYVGDVLWGRCNKGWISLDYTDYNPELLEQYRNHSYGDWYTSREATCVTPGQQRRDCQYCDHYQTQDTAVGGHSFGDWYTSREATCIADGEQRRDCKHCDAFETQPISTGGHSFGDWYVIREGNCTEPALEQRDCILCGESETRQGTSGTHAYGQWYEIQAATCTSAGQERRDCGICGASETREIPQLSHAYGEWFVYQEATCVAPGQERRLCQVCGSYESREIPLTGHSFGQWYETTAPTADAPGEERRDCAHCDHFEVRVVEPTEHTYGQWYVVIPATCTEEGQERRDCTHCAEEYQVRSIPATGHAFSAWETVKAPDCVNTGIESRFCANCGHTETSVMEALGHNYTDWMVLREATCTENGEKVRVCQTCSAYERETLFATGHALSDWKVVTEPTCTESGERVRGCSTCGEMEWEILPATGHRFGQWYSVTDAACGKPGQERRDCQICGFSETRTTESMDHQFGDWYVAREATCGVAGQERRDCAVCGYAESRQIPALTHAFGAWYVYKEATATENGEERRECANCGSYESRVIEKTAELITKVYAIVHDYTVNVRAGMGTSYAKLGVLFFGDRVEVLEQKTASGGLIWGRIGENAWIRLSDFCIVQTVQETAGQTVTKIWATVTCDALKLRQGPGVEFDQVGVLKNGERVEILDQVQVEDLNWGRTAKGWICLTGYTELETETITTGGGAVYAPTILGTVTYNGLNVRSGPGTGYSKVSTLALGKKIEILEMTMVGTMVWGRFDGGWTRLDGYVTLELVMESQGCTNHSFGSWEITKPATCTENGLRTRKCANCGETEEQLLQAPGHSFSEWAVVTPGSCTEPGEEVRICYACGYTEIRESESSGHTYSEWISAVKPTCEKEGTEVRACSLCGATQTRTVPATGHSFGQWYETKTPTATQYGEERRDCAACDAYETRKTDPLGGSDGPVTKVYGTVTGGASVNIRGGVGASYALLGTLKYGDRVEILEQKQDSYGRTWGRISDNGWVCISGYLKLQTLEENADGTGIVTKVTKTYGTVTTRVNIRGGVGPSYDLLGSLEVGAKVVILETKKASNGWIWGRISDNGWICLTGYVSQETVTETQVSNQLPVTLQVKASKLYLYQSASSSAASNGYLIYGMKIEILEQKIVNGQLWARTLMGWIRGEDLA